VLYLEDLMQFNNIGVLHLKFPNLL